jgi:hypothetical protein
MTLDGIVKLARYFIFIFLLSVLLLSLHSHARADVIHLKDGRKITGRIISEDDTEVIIERGTMRAGIPRKDIERIERGPEAGKETSAASAEQEIKRAEDLYAKGHYREAASIFKRVLRGGDKSEEVKRMAGLCDSLACAKSYLAKKMLKEARESTSSALALDKENACALEVLSAIEKYDKVLKEKGSLPGKFLVRTTRHFEIHHHQPYLASEVADKAEEHLEYLLDALLYEGCSTPSIKKKFKIYIHRDRKEYEAHAGKLGELYHSMTLSKTEIGTFQETALSKLRHEITHLLVHIILPSMPVWVHEGLADAGYERAKAAVYSRARAYIDKKSFLPFDEFLKIRTPDKMEMSIGAFYLQSRMAVEFLIFGRGGMEKFHKFAKRSRELMVEDANAYARTQKKKKVVVRNIDWIEKPMRKMLAELYDYADLKEFDADLKGYILHREKEAAWQEQQLTRKLEAKWKYSLRLDSKHFALFTTCSKKEAQELLDMAERLYEAFYLEFADCGMFVPAKVKIYLFNRKKEYADFLKSQGSQVRQGSELIPHFNPWSGAACVFREKQTRDYLHQTAAHEIAHALSVSVMKSFSGRGTWVVEGIAHYVGLSIYSKTDRIVFGKIHETDKSAMTGFLKRMMSRNQVMAVKDFVDLTMQGLRKDFLRTTVQCWSLFHFLQHGGNGKYRKGFHKYLREICAGRGGGSDVFEKFVGGFDDLDRAYLEYAKSLKADSKTK